MDKKVKFRFIKNSRLGNHKAGEVYELTNEVPHNDPKLHHLNLKCPCEYTHWRNEVEEVFDLPDSAQVAVDREIQKVWQETPSTGKRAKITDGVPELPAPVRQTPEVRCACCHVKAPRVVVNDHPRAGYPSMREAQVNQPNLHGWMLIINPFDDWFGKGEFREGIGGRRFGQNFNEVKKVCPACATKVLGILNHMNKPYPDEEV